MAAVPFFKGWHPNLAPSMRSRSTISKIYLIRWYIAAGAWMEHAAVCRNVRYYEKPLSVLPAPTSKLPSPRCDRRMQRDFGAEFAEIFLRFRLEIGFWRRPEFVVWQACASTYLVRYY